MKVKAMKANTMSVRVVGNSAKCFHLVQWALFSIYKKLTSTE